jgi:secreted PhoX family phosphatase
MPAGTGGASALEFDAGGNAIACYPILSGTSGNCAGGKMPWGTWLSCEENGDAGRVFACDPLGLAPAVDLPALGRFAHEAAAWDTTQRALYLTEDRPDGGLYRFTPSSFDINNVPDLSSGTLEVARVAPALVATVTWLAVPDPSGAVTPTRGQVATMTRFNRGEGIVAHNGIVHFATTGDNRIWAYDTLTTTLSILYDAKTSASPILAGPDNIEVSSGDDLLVAEDGGDMQIVALTPDGQIFPVLQLVGHDSSEVAGPAIDPSGTRLYFSSQRGTTGTPAGGLTFEVSGPFLF